MQLKGGSKTLNSKFPWKVSSSGEGAFTLSTSIENNTDLKIYNALFMHPPNEPPLFLQKNDAIEFDGGKIIEIFIIPNVILTDNDLKSFEIKDRVCFFDDEKQLRFFKDYSIKNCQLECFANFSTEICGCVPFDVVRDMKTPICEVWDYECINELHYEINFEKNSNKSKLCNCLQPCNSITYDFEFIETRFVK